VTSNWADRLPDVHNVHRTLGISMDECTPERVVLSLEVGPDTHQYFGVLHGGVSALLAEGAASIGAVISVGDDEVAVGTDLNCSHLRPVTSGRIRAIATPIRKGRSVHVWGIELYDDADRLISVARCTLQVIKRPTN